MITGFRDFLTLSDSFAYFTFGRMNPPTAGHEKVLDSLSEQAGKHPYFVYLTQSNDNINNPLPYKSKIKHARKMFPQHARRIIADGAIRTITDAATHLYEEGYKNLVLVTGDERVTEFDVVLNKYNGVERKGGFYNFESISVVSAGSRLDGISSTNQRFNVRENDFSAFSQGLPKSFSNLDAQVLFNDLRVGMGLTEQKDFKRHVRFDPVSEEREKYVRGELFQKGDHVVVKETGEKGVVNWLGSNYVVLDIEGQRKRKWLSDVVEDATKVPQDNDIKDREGTQPSKYHKGLSKKTKEKRDAQFKRQSKMSDSDPNAYKPAPGDAEAETKPSKYTKAFKAMYGEQSDPIKRVKASIDNEKKRDEVRHDRMLDRARLKATRIKNKGTGKDDNGRGKKFS